MSDESSGLKKVFQMGFGILMSRVLGLIRDILMLSLFPIWVTDAWVTAFKLPHLWRRLWSEGGVSVALMPQYLKEKQEDHQLLSWVGVFLVMVVILGFFAASSWISFLRPDLELKDPSEFKLTLLFFRIMVVFLATNAFYALITAQIHSLGDFKSPSGGMVLFNVCLIVFLGMPQGWSSIPGLGMALGVAVGGVAQSGFIFWIYRKHNKKIKMKLNLGFSQITQRQLKKLTFSFIGLNALGIMNLFNLYHLNGLGVGWITSFFIVERLLEFPLSLISNTSSTVNVGQWSVDVLKKKSVKELYQSTLWIMPFVVGALAGAQFLIPLLFQHGKIQDFQVDQMTTILKGSAGILLLGHLNRLSGSYAFARHQENRQSLWVVGCCLIHFITCFWWTPQWGVMGLLMSQTLVMSLLFLASSSGIKRDIRGAY